MKFLKMSSMSIDKIEIGIVKQPQMSEIGKNKDVRDSDKLTMLSLKLFWRLRKLFSLIL